MDFYSRQWLTHCRNEFPRSIGFVKDPSPKRKQEICQTADEFLLEMWTHVAHLDLYTAVYSERQKEYQEFDTLYTDFDSDNLEEAHHDMQKVAHYIYMSDGQFPRTYFSAGKGFHIFFDFAPRRFAHFKEVAHLFVDDLVEFLGLTTADYSVVGDWGRISALPYSLHTSAGRIRIPIDPMWSLEEILHRSNGNGTRSRVPITIPQLRNVREHLVGLDRSYQEPEPPPRMEIDGQTGHDDLDYILQHAPNFKGVRRILWTKVIPIFKAQQRSPNDLVAYARQMCQLANFSWSADLENYTRSNYACDKGIPWSWGAIFRKWPEIKKWFR